MPIFNIIARNFHITCRCQFIHSFGVEHIMHTVLHKSFNWYERYRVLNQDTFDTWILNFISFHYSLFLSSCPLKFSHTLNEYANQRLSSFLHRCHLFIQQNVWKKIKGIESKQRDREWGTKSTHTKKCSELWLKRVRYPNCK